MIDKYEQLMGNTCICPLIIGKFKGCNSFYNKELNILWANFKN